MNRPANANRIHFSVDGAIALMSTVGAGMIRHGDTASASTPDAPDTCWLWRCVPIEGDYEVIGETGPPDGPAFGWLQVEPWTKTVAKDYIDRADLVAVVVDESAK